MSDITNQDLKELILAMDKKFDQRFVEVNLQFAEMDKKIEVGFTELKGEIKRVETELKGEISRVETHLTGEIKRIDQKFDAVDKRLIAEETWSRNVFVALIVTILTAGVKYFFFPSSPIA
jgi:hypothetical protein